MFSKFGEFDSVEELNLAAEGLLKEGDTASLLELAKENGIEKEDTEDYISGDLDTLASLHTAAYGRITVDERENIDKLKNPIEKMAMQTIIAVLKEMCTEDAMAAGVMRKGKRSIEVFNAMKRGAEKHKSGNIGMSCGTDRELRGIIRTYYLESGTKLTEKIETLYAGIKEKTEKQKGKKV